MLSIFSYGFQPSICLWRNVYLDLLPIFNWVVFWYWATWDVCVFWRLITCQSLFCNYFPSYSVGETQVLLDGMLYKYKLSPSELLCHFKALCSLIDLMSRWSVHWCKSDVTSPPTIIVLLSASLFMAVSIGFIY